MSALLWSIGLGLSALACMAGLLAWALFWAEDEADDDFEDGEGGR